MITADRPRESGFVRAARFGGVGFEFAGIVVTGVIVGYYIDELLGTAPLFVLLLTFGGMGGAIYRLIWMLRRLQERDREEGRGS